MKTALITGISRGIGKALAEKFLKEGHFVIGTSTNGVIDISNESLSVFALDLSLEESIVKCVSDIVGVGRSIDILINNAGVVLDENLNYVKIELLRKTLEINLIGTINFTERIIPYLAQDGHILNESSSAGSLTLNDESDDDEYPAYHISKTALNMYTRTLAVRLRGKAVVSSFHPGWVRTDMGGEEADISPEEASEYIFKTATAQLETGQFWYKGEKFPW